MKPWARDPRSKEPGGTGDESGGRAHLIEETARDVPSCHQRARFISGEVEGLAGDALPELSELVDSQVRRIAGDDCTVDRSDRDPGDPSGMQVGLRQRLIDPGLVSAEGTATLKQQDDV